jgi:diguanylate cyclase (GGDEF)-like protein
VKLSWSARTVVAAAVTGGLVALGLAADALVVHHPVPRQLAIAAVFAALMCANWVWPLIIYVGDQSETAQLDEAFFVVLVLLVSPATAIVVFAVATIVAQAIRRRPTVKSAFNVGQVLTAMSAGLIVFGLVDHRVGHLRLGDMAAAVLGAVVYFVVNSSAVGGILATTGSSCRQAMLGGLDVRLVLIAGGIAIALTTALLLSDDFWALPLAIVPLLLLRVVLAGHFESRHDRSRLHRLFEAALEAHRSMGDDQVKEALLRSARELLRCPVASLTDRPGPQGSMPEGSMCALVELPGQPLWLTVSGRSPAEPFDDADWALLDALAAMGAGALANAELYEENRRQRERLGAITSSLGEGVCAVSASGQITFMNPAAAIMLAGTTEETGPDAMLSVRDGGPFAPNCVLGPAMRAVDSGKTVSNHDARFLRADGSYLHVAFTVSPMQEEGRPSGAVLVFRDITERKAFEEQLTRHAFHDALTGLPNRRLFLDHLDHALRRSKRSNESHAVLFLDVDRFKVINDSLGHHAGDRLLIAIAERIQGVLRPGDMLSRFGGDEFTILLEGVNPDEDPIAVSRRILACLEDPILLPDGHEVVVSLSIGIAVGVSGRNRDDVLRDADVAMYRAKARGTGGHYEVFDPQAMGVRSAERIELESALRRAIDAGELAVHYQPMFSTDDKRIVGAEALVRWDSAERGMLSPADFIGLAEESGLILPIGRFVLEQACRQARKWRDEFGVSLTVGVNLSARQFQHSGLEDEIESVLLSTGVDPSQICLEITESLAMDDVERTILALCRLKSLGIRLAIDDFGTGYSGLGYLASFPVDIIKIDRSFVDNIVADPVKSAIASAVVTMSHAIGATTVAEGVETAEEFDHVRSLGCPVIQGYHLARPMPAGGFDEMLRAANPPAPPRRKRARLAPMAPETLSRGTAAPVPT